MHTEVDLVILSVALTLVHHSLPLNIRECGIYSSYIIGKFVFNTFHMSTQIFVLI